MTTPKELRESIDAEMASLVLIALVGRRSISDADYEHARDAILSLVSEAVLAAIRAKKTPMVTPETSSFTREDAIAAISEVTGK